MVSLQSYRIFSLVARERSFTGAAQRMKVSQQSVSQHIARLEQHYGIALFDRKTPLKLTYGGEQLLRFCREIEVIDKNIESEMRDIAAENRGEVTIGVTHAFGNLVMPRVLPAYRELYPRVRVNCVEGSSDQTIDALFSETVDFIIAISSAERKDVVSIDLLQDSTRLLVAESVLRQFCPGSLEELLRTGPEEAVPIALFRDCPFLLHTGDNQVRRACDRMFRDEDIPVDPVFTSGDTGTLASLAIQAVGAAFIPVSVIPKTEAGAGGRVLQFRVREMSYSETLKASYLRGRYLSKKIKAFLWLLSSTFSGAQ